MPTVLSVTMAVEHAFWHRNRRCQPAGAIEELAGIDVLCSDKTGTLTQNKLTLEKLFCVEGVTPEQVILAGAWRRAAIRTRSTWRSLAGCKIQRADGFRTTHYTPFDPVHKRTEATLDAPDGKSTKAIKGAPQVILELAANAAQVKPAGESNRYRRSRLPFLGRRPLKRPGQWQFLGVPPFDPPRE
ncbi:MAG: hypothetical protein R2748_18360 [Bryobacterales bacterium]